MSVRVAYTAMLLSAATLAACAGERAPRDLPATSISVGDVGFQTPESALHDPIADVYLVANINGSPLEKDDNGFISRVGPDGTVRALKWIDGTGPDVTLHAPKGMGLKGDTLFVADIDVVRLFDRASGRALGDWAVPGATFLNDVTVGADGTVYVTDFGVRAGAQGFEPAGTDALHRFRPDGSAEAVMRDATLGSPNGVIVNGATATIVTWSGEIMEIHLASRQRTRTLARGPGGQLDGVVRLADGSLLVSSWEGQAVYRVSGDSYTVAVDGVEAPADIGYDAGRGRLLIPLFMANRLEIREVR